jgi:hypothetical protein
MDWGFAGIGSEFGFVPLSTIPFATIEANHAE